MYNQKSVTAIVLTAGNSSRMGLDINKVYINANHEIIVQYSLSAFDIHPYVDDIFMVVRHEDKDFLLDLITREHFPKKPVWVVTGGAVRCESVFNALERVTSDIVLIQDGARPLLRQQYITDCVEAMDRYPGAAVAIPADGSMFMRGDDGFMRAVPAEGRLFHVQTPQCFHTKILRECHETIHDKTDVTDDCMLLERAGYEVKMLEGDSDNIKITTPSDLALAGVLLKR